MASDEMRKKWGTIFMGNREASVEQLNAMQEPLYREKLQKDSARDYMERVRARAADRAREILGAAYAERQKVLEEARAEGAAQKLLAEQAGAKLKAEGEAAKKQALAELDNARSIREEAERIRAAAHEEGVQTGMEEAAKELHEFRAELGQSVGAVLLALERQRKNIAETWRDELVELVKCAVQAGAGFVLKEEHEAILRALVLQSLDMLENRSVITARVNPEDEAAVSDMFRAARERVPELSQWVVTGDPGIEKGGLIADSGSGSVDMRRENFRGMVEGVLAHLALPENAADEARSREVQDIVEREVAHIASLTPELDQPEPATAEPPAPPQPDAAPRKEPVAEETPTPVIEEQISELAAPAEALLDAEISEATSEETRQPLENEQGSDTYAALEEELFPLEEDTPEGAPPVTQEVAVVHKEPVARVESEGPEPATQASMPASEGAQPPRAAKPAPVADPATLAEGGFL